MPRSSASARHADVISVADARRRRLNDTAPEAYKNGGITPVETAPRKPPVQAGKLSKINRASGMGSRTGYPATQYTSRKPCTPIPDDALDDFITASSVRSLRERFPHEHSSHTAMLQRAKQEKATVHDDLRSLKSFLRHLRQAPSPSHTVDRTNNSDKEYAPGRQLGLYQLLRSSRRQVVYPKQARDAMRSGR